MLNTTTIQIIVWFLTKILSSAAESIDWSFVESELHLVFEKILPDYPEADRFITKTIISLFSESLADVKPGTPVEQSSQAIGKAFETVSAKLVRTLAESAVKKAS